VEERIPIDFKEALRHFQNKKTVPLRKLTYNPSLGNKEVFEFPILDLASKISTYNFTHDTLSLFHRENARINGRLNGLNCTFQEKIFSEYPVLEEDTKINRGLRELVRDFFRVEEVDTDEKVCISEPKLRTFEGTLVRVVPFLFRKDESFEVNVLLEGRLKKQKNKTSLALPACLMYSPLGGGVCQYSVHLPTLRGIEQRRLK